MSDTYDSETGAYTIKIHGDVLAGLQTRDELRRCGGCGVFRASTEFEAGQCPACRADRPASLLMSPAENSKRLPCGCYIEWATISGQQYGAFYHCTPKDVPASGLPRREWLVERIEERMAYLDNSGATRSEKAADLAHYLIWQWRSTKPIADTADLHDPAPFESAGDLTAPEAHVHDWKPCPPGVFADYCGGCGARRPKS